MMKKETKAILSNILLGASLHAEAAGNVPTAGDIPRAEPPRVLPSPTPAKIAPPQKPAYQAVDSEKAIKLTIQTFHFIGNNAFSSEQLNSLLARYTNQEVGINELNDATKIITEFYRKNGYFLAQAYLPAQDVTENAIEIAVIEGMLGELTLSDTDGFDKGFMSRMAAYKLEKGTAVSEKNLVRNVTLLNALPSTRATAQLTPSDEIGGTDAEITLLPLPRFEAYLGTNTYGNRFTGREVLIAGARLNNPAGLGDQLSIDVKRSNDNGQRGIDLGYITPVHASGTMLSFRYNYIDYKLGGTFKALDAYGKSQYFNIALEQPILRDAQKGISARFSTTYKVMNDEVSTFSLENQRNIFAADIGLEADWLNKAGDVSHQLGVNIRTGKVMFQDDFAQVLDETGSKTKGGFAKYNLNVSRLQYFEGGTSLALRADYQRASKNLDSVERISIGGINRWRQYAELPSLADTGVVVGAELRKKIPANTFLAKILLLDISPYGFVDYGQGRLNQKPKAGDNHVKSTHIGLGLDATFKNAWLFSVTASHQNRDFEGSGAENEVRFWGQLQKFF